MIFSIYILIIDQTKIFLPLRCCKFWNLLVCCFVSIAHKSITCIDKGFIIFWEEITLQHFLPYFQNRSGSRWIMLVLEYVHRRSALYFHLEAWGVNTTQKAKAERLCGDLAWCAPGRDQLRSGQRAENKPCQLWANQALPKLIPRWRRWWWNNMKEQQIGCTTISDAAVKYNWGQWKQIRRLANSHLYLSKSSFSN